MGPSIEILAPVVLKSSADPHSLQKRCEQCLFFTGRWLHRVCPARHQIGGAYLANMLSHSRNEILELSAQDGENIVFAPPITVNDSGTHLADIVRKLKADDARAQRIAEVRNTLQPDARPLEYSVWPASCASWWWTTLARSASPRCAFAVAVTNAWALPLRKCLLHETLPPKVPPKQVRRVPEPEVC